MCACSVIELIARVQAKQCIFFHPFLKIKIQPFKKAWVMGIENVSLLFKTCGWHPQSKQKLCKKKNQI